MSTFTLTLTKTCSICHTSQPCEVDIICGQPTAAIETQPCHADDCTAKLCQYCEQFKCAGCDLTHCREHGILLSDGIWCPCCVKNFVDEGQLELAEDGTYRDTKPEAECECVFSGDMADASGCRLHS